MWKATEGWKVKSVVRSSSIEWVVVLEHEEDGKAEIKIQEYEFISQMHELFEGKRQRLYFAYGMRDIDVYCHNGNFVVMHSVHEGSYVQHVLAEGEFSKSLEMIDLQEDNKTV